MLRQVLCSYLWVGANSTSLTQNSNDLPYCYRFWLRLLTRACFCLFLDIA